MVSFDALFADPTLLRAAPHACLDAAAVNASGAIALRAHLAAWLALPPEPSPPAVGLAEGLAAAHWQRRRAEAVEGAVGPLVRVLRLRHSLAEFNRPCGRVVAGAA